MFEINWYNLKDSIIVTLFLVYVFRPFCWMIIYEHRYYKNAGEDYLHYGGKYVKNKFINCSNGNIGNEK